MSDLYPDKVSHRNQWILRHRGNRHPQDPWQAAPFVVEPERSATGEIENTATLFLTNSECPWRCLMCDLWQYTLPGPTPPGSLVRQIQLTLEKLPPAHTIKLYNAGSFFDPKAVPTSELKDIAHACGHFDRVIVESHPSLVHRSSVLQFRDALSGQLEIAMGLETIHPEVLAKLNKGITVEDFQKAASTLLRHCIDLRTFVLLRPPFLSEEEGIHWAVQSVRFARQCNSTATVIIPTRTGNGALNQLQTQGLFSPPKLSSLEISLSQCLQSQSGRVFADLWNLEKFSHCPQCYEQRRESLLKMNLSQTPAPPTQCPHCAGSA
ncbi:MAG: hypothetical protein RI897_3735 [Verrucomicrobiota bacterium]